MKLIRLVRLLPLLVLATTLTAAEQVAVYRAGDELIVKFDRLDLLRQRHTTLTASVEFQPPTAGKPLLIDLLEPALQGAVVIDLGPSGKCDGVTVTVKDATGAVIVKQVVAPIRQMSAPSGLAPGKSFAYIEPGAEMLKSAQARPQIPLPEAGQLRQVTLAPATRLVAKRDITFPITSGVDLPLVGGAVVGRQTAFPKDPARASIYFACKKAIYAGTRVERWQKFLLEVPVQAGWGTGRGDENIVLSPDQFEVHVTNEKSPGGANMLGAGDGDLGQKGEIDSDDQDRIYWRVEGGGAYVVRFNPHTKKFEQPPVRLDFQKLVPAGLGMLNDNLCKVSCTHGRVFFTMCNDTLTNGDPGNAHRRRLGGIFSIPQDWSDAAAFEADVRLHVGSWETAANAFYKAPPKADADVRKLGVVSVTEAGLFITTAGSKYEGGPWRLDLDERGNTRFFGEVNAVSDTMSKDGRSIEPTQFVTVQGIPKGRELNPGTGGGRNLIRFSQGEVTIPRASVRLLLMDRIEGLTLRAERKGAFPTYDGAPPGLLTVRYDLVAKLRTAPAAQGPLAASLTGGASMGPAFLVSPIPGEPGRAVAVCEYAGYPLSVLDFSALATSRTVTKTFLPPQTPVRAGLGPYNSAWVRDGDEQWLYLSGYTGLSRILYAKAGKALPTMTSDLFNSRLAQSSTDGHTRTSMKKIDGLLPVFGGRLLDAGYGLDGRGADAFSTGVELFDPHRLGTSQTNSAASQTSAHLSRCFALKTVRSRLVWSAADGSVRQEVFAASGSIRKQLINELKDPATGPANLDAKVFLYEVSERTGLRGLYGFSLPKLDHERAVEGHLVLSPCNRFLVLMTQDGAIYSYSLAQRRFVDGLRLRTPGGEDIRPIEFKRPSEIIFTAPDGQIFFLTEPLEATASAVHFQRVQVGDDGRLTLTPHLGITFDSREGQQDLGGIVRCFLPAPANHPGTYDFVLGYNQSTVQPFVRVIRGFTATMVVR